MHLCYHTKAARQAVIRPMGAFCWGLQRDATDCLERIGRRNNHASLRFWQSVQEKIFNHKKELEDA